jgi:hypothetical protein
MGRRPNGEKALTGAEREARYRLRPGMTSERASDQAMPRRLPRGHTLSRRWNDTVQGCSPYERSMHVGSRHCRKPRARAPPAKPYRPWWIWTWRRSWRSNRRAASDAIDQPDVFISHNIATEPHDTLPARPFCPEACP